MARGLLARVGQVAAGLLATVVLLALLVGVPYGLTRWIGWPLPHHWPTPTQVKATLTGPFTDRILLDILACLCWLVWVIFVVDTARALPDTLREARHHAGRGGNPAIRQPAFPGRSRPSGPLRGLATLLLIAILTGVLSLRPHPSDLSTHSGPPRSEARPAAAISLQSAPVSPQLTPSMSPSAATAPLVATGSREANTATVQPPHDGIHDSLWRIAQRCLGDGDRWPEIYQLNQGLPQPDGGRLTNPSMIRPGWILHLPSPDVGTTTPTRPHSPTPPATTRAPNGPPRQTQPPSSPTRGTPTPTTPATQSVSPASPASPARGSLSDAPTHATGSREHSGVDLGDGVYVSLGLAAAISGALVTVRRRNRRWYSPGSGRRDDLPVAPVVRSLHLAHLRATAPPTQDDDHTDGNGTGGTATRGEEPDDESEGHAVAALWRDQRRAAMGRPTKRDHFNSAIDLSIAHGLGLVGPGAGDAARAMLLDVLSVGAGTTGSPGGDGPGWRFDVLIPAGDLELLTGRRPSGVGLPSQLHLVADLSAALDQLESAILTRARRRDQQGGDSRPREAAAIALFTRVPSDVARLQAVLDNGAAVAIAGVLLGQWRAGTSVYVETDGVVSAAHGPAAPTLGARLFILPKIATRTLLGLLHDADRPGATAPSTDTDTPGARDADSAKHAHGAGRHVNGAGSTTPTRGPTEAGLMQALTTVDPEDEDHHPPDLGSRPDPPIPAAGHPAPTEEIALRRGPHGGESKTPLQLRVLGPLSLAWTGHPDPSRDPGGAGGAESRPPGGVAPVEIISALSPRVRELLVALAVHPDGITRDRLADTLWPESAPGRPFNSLNTTLGRLRTALTRATHGQLKEIVLTAGDQHRLDPALIEVDYATFAAAAQARQRATTEADRAQAWQRMLATYRGELAEGIGAEWLETPREAIRRDAVDAATGLARLVVSDDPRQALDLLEAARARDPYNEALYGDIMRVQRRLGQADAIGRTLSLLATRLAELGETPSVDTVGLAEALQRAASRPPGSSRPSDPAAGITVESTTASGAEATS